VVRAAYDRSCSATASSARAASIAFASAAICSALTVEPDDGVSALDGDVEPDGTDVPFDGRAVPDGAAPLGALPVGLLDPSAATAAFNALIARCSAALALTTEAAFVAPA
jgi:hypothetical protein